MNMTKQNKKEKMFHLPMDSISVDSSSCKCLYTWPATLDPSMRFVDILCFPLEMGGVLK